MILGVLKWVLVPLNNKPLVAPEVAEIVAVEPAQIAVGVDTIVTASIGEQVFAKVK